MEQTTAFEISANQYTLFAFIGYILIILVVGILSAKFSSKGLSEFFLGGRKMNKFVVALSAVVSGRSSWLLIGLSGMAYMRGISAIWAAVGYIVVEFLMFLYAAPRLREQTEIHDNITIPDYFESRHNDSTHLLRFLSVIIIVVFMTAYISAQLAAGGKAFSASFDVSQFHGVVITAIIVLLYTLLGGFLAVSVTDVIQAVFMLIALFVLPIVAIIDFGGITVVIQKLTSHNIGYIDPFSLTSGALIGFVGIGLGSPGNPHILVRYMSIRKKEHLRFSAYVGTFWNIMMAAAAVLIGLIGRAYFISVNSLPDADPENIFPFLAQIHLHPILFGIVIASILAAIMSTADSMLLVSASAIVRDIYQKIVSKENKLSDKQLVLYSRFIIVLIMVFAFLFGYVAQDLVFWLVLFAWGGLGAAFGPPLLLSLFWKRTSKYGVAAGFISGMISIIVWNQIDILKNLIYELVPAFFISLIFTILFSLIFKANERYVIIRNLSEEE